MANKYDIHYSTKYKKLLKNLIARHCKKFKLSSKNLQMAKFWRKNIKTNKLKGIYRAFRECHIRPNLCLIYQKIDDILVLVLVDVGSHSDLGLTS